MKISKNITRAFHMAALRLRVHSPEILVVTGVVGTVVGTVMACKATMKLDDILSEAAENVECVKTAETGTFPKASEPSETVDYTEDDRKKDLAVCYVQTGVKVAKLYAPAAIVMTASVVSILTGHNLLRKRNLALAAAYATVDKSYRLYRKGVIDKFGDAVDREICGVKPVEVTDTVTDEKTGEPKEVKRTVDAVESDILPNAYARLFTEGCKGWKKDLDYNELFLNAQQRYANDLLVSRGHLFLNEVYDMLGFEATKAGQIVGWIYDPKKSSGDNFVDFGIREVSYLDNAKTEAIDYRDKVYDVGYILDFNVDGNILDRI